MAQLGVCGNITRFAFVILNVIFLLIGLALIGGGSYLVHTGTNLDFFTGSNFFSGAVILIVAGIITFLITIAGIIGALVKSKFLLGIYLFAVVLIVVLEIVAGILGFVYRDRVEAQALDIADRAIGEYRSPDAEDYNKATNEAIDEVQRDFKCCGWSGPDQWINTAYYNDTTTLSYPDSCNCTSQDEECDIRDEQNIYITGCQRGVTDFFRDNLIAAGAIGVAFGLLEILAVLMAVGLCICIVRSDKEYTTV